jgi:trehalose 6-phosphate phosphatase
VPHDRASSASLDKPPPLDARVHALFLDLDGTLVNIATRPEAVVAGDGLRNLLGALTERFDGAVALVTGRTIESAETVLGGAIETIAGLHGFERRFEGAITRARDDLTAINAAIAEAHALVASGELQARIEDKTAGVALHYREHPSAASSVRRAAETLAEKHGLSVLEGKMVAELSFGVRTKGDALNAFMQEAPFLGRTPVALGDDVTDEHAFAAAFAGGGFGVLVGAPKVTAARFALPDTKAVSSWLAAGLAA